MVLSYTKPNRSLTPSLGWTGALPLARKQPGVLGLHYELDGLRDGLSLLSSIERANNMPSRNTANMPVYKVFSYNGQGEATRIT